MKAAKSTTIVIAGGGTGGHLFPGIALARQFKIKWDARIVFIGTSYGLENRVLPDMPYEFNKIWIRGLQRNFSLQLLLFPLRLVVSLIQCVFIFIKIQPMAVVGTGGYVSGPALIAGILFGIPTAIQEQNSYPGLVNRLLGKRVRQIHLTYEDSRKYFKGKAEIFMSGNPVRAELKKINREQALKKLGLLANKITLFVFGGSQGARGINNALAAALPLLSKLQKLQVLWAVGATDFDKFSLAAQEFERINIKPFLEDMASAYAAADFVLCRSGATTLAELALVGLPAILVPYPFAAEGHQEKNARSVEKAGAAQVILEKELTTNILVKTVKEFLENCRKRQTIAEASAKLARPDAAREIAEKVMTLIEES